MKADFINHLNERIREAKDYLDRARKESLRLGIIIESLEIDIKNYEGALRAEMRRIEDNQEPPQIDDTPTEVKEPESGNFPASPEPEASTDDGSSKSGEIVKIINENAIRGIRPPDILKTLIARGVDIHPNYVYSALGRLRKKGKVRVRTGKYYPPLKSQATEPVEVETVH